MITGHGQQQIDHLNTQVSIPIHHLLPLNLHHILLSSHLRQPTRRRNTRLLINRAQQRRQTLQDITNRSRSITTSSRILTRIPHRDLGLQPINRLGIRLGQFFVGVVLEHHVRQETLGAAEDGGHVFVSFCQFGNTGCFFLFGDEGGFGFFCGAVE